MKCPKCGAEIPRFDLNPNCKKCGVHIMYYTQEEDLARDARKTELEFASARLLLAKFKAAFLQGKASLVRILFLVLSVAALLLPHYNINFTFPWWDYQLSVGALGVYNMINDSIWQIFDALCNIGVGKSLFLLTVCSLILLIASVLCIIFCIGAWLFSFVNIKKSAIVSVIFTAIAMLSQLSGLVLSFIATNLSGTVEHITVTPMFGGLLGFFTLLGVLISSIMLISSEPQIIISDADRQRLEIKRKLKADEITLDELPLPIVKEEKKEEAGKAKKRGKNK